MESPTSFLAVSFEGECSFTVLSRLVVLVSLLVYPAQALFFFSAAHDDQLDKNAEALDPTA